MLKLGVVLSGGGARCVAHLGILQALEDLGIRPDAIAGASGGAVLGALYAAGDSPRQILKAVKASADTGLLNKVVAGSGLFTANGLTQFFAETKLPERFEPQAKPLWVSATDLCTRSSVTFSEGDLHKVLLASCSVPGIFIPVCYKNYELIDGGVLDNLPVGEIRGACDTLIGANVNKLKVSLTSHMSRLQVLDRCFHMVISAQVNATFSWNRNYTVTPCSN